MHKNLPKIVTFLLLIFAMADSHAKPFPIQFAIHESKIVKEIPEKDQDFAFIIPGNIRTYIYNEESEYYKDYQRSFFALTWKKGGWDCMRHYEILANGCIPYFVDLDQCDPNTMQFLPRELIKEAMNLEGVSCMRIDHTKFDRAKYNEILNKILAHTRKYLTTKSMAQYLLSKINYSGTGKILLLSGDDHTDYLRDAILMGLKELYPTVVEVPKIDSLYKSYTGDLKQLYGKGISYAKNLDDFPVDRENIERRIEQHEFDLIVYGNLNRGLPFHARVLRHYSSTETVYICGDDEHHCHYYYWPNLFLREWEGNIR